jgi:DNA gyrase subunit A
MSPGPISPPAPSSTAAPALSKPTAPAAAASYMRAKPHIEVDAKTGRQSIIFTEIPYQLNKARVIEKIAELVKDKKLEGISELRDESDKDGMRIVIEVKRGEVAEVVVNNLFAQTQLQSSFSFNMVALVRRPAASILNLKDLISRPLSVTAVKW